MAQSNSDNRLGEISSNIGKDFDDLVKEIQKMFVDFFHDGVCNILSIPEKFKELHSDIVASFGKFKTKPLEAYWNKAAESFVPQEFHNSSLFRLDPTEQPVVTIISSSDEKFKQGEQRDFSGMNKWLDNIGGEYKANHSTKAENTIELQIDYTLNGKRDQLHVKQKLDGSSITDTLKGIAQAHKDNPEKINNYFDTMPLEIRDICKAKLVSFLNDSVDNINNKIIPYLETHEKLFFVEHNSSQAKFDPNSKYPVGYLQSMEPFIKDCRDMLNHSDGNCKLPNIPTIEEFNKQRTAVKVAPIRQRVSVREQLKQAKTAVKSDANTPHMRKVRDDAR